MDEKENFFKIKEASTWASEYTGRNVTTANINYLIQYGRIRKIGNNGNILVDKGDLIDYYKSQNGNRESNWKNKLGADLNWHLSFEQYKESDTTKHVHRLHPYKGKFIPQLVEYFLDSHTDEFKKAPYFKKGDIILDPFCGSGTTLVQCNELGMHAIGIDISAFNSLISNCKIIDYDFIDLNIEIKRITSILKSFLTNHKVIEFESRLTEELSNFNNQYFPVPEYKYKIRNKIIDENLYSKEKEEAFLSTYHKLINEYNISLIQRKSDNFLDTWFLQNIKDELDLVFSEIKKIGNIETKKILSIILSRTMRSCRATTHTDLATLKEPMTKTYYCAKHGKICKPLFSILRWWSTYSKDTVARLMDFTRIKTETHQICLTGDSRTIDIFEAIKKKSSVLADLLKTNKIKGIFSSPPYVGLIDYHEQHAYAYDLFGFERNDDLEIGPLFKGQGKEARDSYVKGISEVLNNSKKYLVEDYDVFLVANDKYNLYQQIAESSSMEIVNQFKRPVLNRTEKDKGAYSEIIFHLKRKK